MLPLFFCIFEILLQMAGIVTICKSHCAVCSDAIPPDWSILFQTIKSPFVWLRDLPYKRAFYLRFVTCKQRLPIQSVD